MEVGKEDDQSADDGATEYVERYVEGVMNG